MERSKGIEAIDGLSLLPEALIQHIQSFLSAKEAAQTALLSKSWYSAWSTRPNLDFDQRDFRRNGQISRFSEFTRMTVQRYEELNRRIESFRLCMKSSETDCCLLANELILKAMRMGVSDLNVEFLSRTETFVLPQEVLGSANLIRLSVSGCRIKLGLDESVRCSRLKSLSLCGVFIKPDMIRVIISSCPMIEKLRFSECMCLSKVRNYLVRLENGMLAANPVTEFRKQNVGSCFDNRINLFEFCKLKHLFLKMVKIGNTFFSDFSSKFPCLKDLTVDNCDGAKKIQIFSPSLECVSFTEKGPLRAKFFVPRIHKFCFSGSYLPALSFETTSMEWESDISILNGEPGTLSLLKLKKLLKNLSQSKVSLSLDIGLISEKNFEYVGDFGGLPRPGVENLMLLMDAPSSVCSALLDCLFWSCRPKFITQYWLPKSRMAWTISNSILCKRLIEQVRQNRYVPNRSMFGQGDLEEVNVEYFEETLAEWQPLPWKTLFDALMSPETEQKMRFQLRWGQ